MSNPFKQALIAAALESQDDAPVAAPAPEVLDEAVGEVAEASQDLDNATDDVNVLEEVQTGLEKICLAMESQSAHLDPSAAGFMFEAANAYLARAGGSLSAAPSLESFNGKTAREAGVLSMETIKEQLVAIWEAIKAALKKVFDAVASFWKRVTVASEGLKQRAEHLKKIAAGLQGEASAATFTDAGLAAKIAVGGKVDSAMTHFGDVVLMADDLQSFIRHGDHDLQLISEVTVAVTGAADAAAVDAATAKLKEYKGLPADAFKSSKDVEGGTEHTTKELPGGYVLGFRTPKVEAAEGETGLQHFSKVVKGTEAVVHRAKHDSVDSALPTLSAKDMDVIASGALAIVKDVQALEELAKKQQANFERMGSLVTKNHSDDEAGKAVVEKIKAFYSAMGKNAQLTMNIPLKLTGTLVVIGRNYITYAEKSAAMYSAKKDEAAPAASDEPKKDEAAAAA